MYALLVASERIGIWLDRIKQRQPGCATLNSFSSEPDCRNRPPPLLLFPISSRRLLRGSALRRIHPWLTSGAPL